MDRTKALLAQYIETRSRQVLYLDETKGDIRWTFNPHLDKRYHNNPLPYAFLNSQSRPTSPPKNSNSTRHAKRFLPGLRITTLNPVFFVRSSLANEGVVGLMYFWKWVKGMIAQHH
jgi:hypothetical protein